MARHLWWYMNRRAMAERNLSARSSLAKLSVSRLLLTLCLILSAIGVPVPAAAIADGGSSGTCMACHRDGAAAHIRDLEQSTHARFGITCTGCHVTEGATPRSAPVPLGDPGTTCTRDRQTAMEICERCHPDVALAFRESLHFRHAGDETPGPTCVACHSSAGGHVIADDSLAPCCAACHVNEGAAGKAWVAAKAPALMQLLRQLTLARSLVADRFDIAAILGEDVTPLREEMRRVEASFRDLPFEWHRFNFVELEARSNRAMKMLESLHGKIEAVVPDTQIAAASSRGNRWSERSSAPAVAPGPPLRFAVSTMLGPVETYEAYVGLFNDLARSLGRSYQFVQRRTYQEINELLLRGELDLAFICSGAFVALPAGAPIEIIALPVVDGKSVYHALILVHENSSVRRFEDLRGSRFAFTDPLSNTGYLYPVFRLAELGTDATRFFSSTMFSGSHDRSILAVYRKLVDAAAVDDLVYKQLVVPQSPYWERLRVVESSPDFAIPPVVASTSVPAEIRARMREFLLGLTSTEEGRRRLVALGFDGFTAAREETYDSIRRMLEVTTAKAPQLAR
jgi:phosphonate transport system substrate-binding protein